MRDAGSGSDLRRFAVARSLFRPTTAARSIVWLSRPDPLAPARAQAHPPSARSATAPAIWEWRWRGTRVEDVFINYGVTGCRR